METKQIVDLCYLSDTMPDIPEHAIPRDNYLDAIEQGLRDKSVFFLDAEEGTGVTTVLSLFAHYHHYNCVSYFNNGLSKILLEPSFIEQSLVRQLYFYIDRTTILTDEQSASLDLKGLYIQLRRKLRGSRETLYFVFDGFDDIPSQSKENIKNLMETLPWDMAKFVFSGNYDKLADFLPKKIKCAPNQILQKFSRYEVISFLKEVQPDLKNEEYDDLCKISGCIGYQLHAMLRLYDKHKSFEPIFKLEDADSNDLYAYNFRVIETAENREEAMKVLALVAFIGIRLTKDDVCNILSIDIDNLTSVLNTCNDYLVYSDNYIVFCSVCNQRYVQKRLEKLRREVELLFIQQFKNKKTAEIYSYMPILLKTMNDKKGLVEYLNSDVMLKNIENSQSLAALNEQCELGFNSADFSDLSQSASIFRFALNKSTSREIEHNELWDYQIDAILSVGEYDKAYGLALTVYLKEERLKALLLIARYEKQLSRTLMDSIRSNILALVDQIDFKHIPDKGMELAKLMFPFDYKIAVDIIERIARSSKNRINIDRLYTLLSISSGQEKDMENTEKFDLLTAKIENDSLKRMTRAVRSIFSKTDVDSIMIELKELPSVQQALYLLQYWIPEHIDTECIGKLVLFAIQSVISISDIERPKVSLISDFCTALPKMTPSEIDQVIVMLDSFQSFLLAPSEEYVRLELKVVEALLTFNEGRACERLQNVYLKIDDFENKSTAVACKSIILAEFDKLGHKKAIEEALTSAPKLQKEIENEIKDLFKKTAYHIKIVEQPIKSLVVDYRSSIDTIIKGMNTQERRSRAYMIAASAYIKQLRPSKWDWNYLTGLISNIDYDMEDRSQVVSDMAKEIVYSKDVNEKVLACIKRYHVIFYNIERSESKCSALSYLYVLFKKEVPADSFADSIAKELLDCWNKVDQQFMKVDLGFLIAKTIAKVSKEEAKEWIKKVSIIQDSYFMASASSVSAFRDSANLYNRTLGILIRSKLTDEKILKEYQEIIDEFESSGEQIISWGKIALYFYLNDDSKKFDELYTRYVAKNLNVYSDYYKKCIIYNAAPAFYLGSKSNFYAQVECADGNFKDACISKVANFIFLRYVETEDSDGYRGQYDLKNRDFENLIDLLNHCDNDSTFFGIFNCICKSLKISRSGVSQDQKQLIINRLERLVNTRLPMKNYIQHDGYKIACQISLSQLVSRGPNQTIYEVWNNQIATIDNIADQVFLYVHAAHYTSSSNRRQQFMNTASNLIKLIPSTFDKSSRLDLCIDECRSSTGGLTKGIVKQYMDVMFADNNGNLADVKRAYDSIYDYDPVLADIFMERMDTDPARNYYKAQLQSHSEHTKKISSAKDKIETVVKFSNREQQIYFSKQLAYQISGKAAIFDVKDTMEIMSIVYRYPVTEVRDALKYFIENVYRKNQLSKNQKNLMLGLYDATLYNLKLVLSLSSGTKEKLIRINYAINESYTQSNPSVILAGEKEKALQFIIEWYKNHLYDNLFIIDAYFSPKDFYLIKMLMNENRNLSVTIITHRKNVEDLSDYQRGWDDVSSDLTGSINIHTVCYENDNSNGPLHARWWLSVDEDDDIRAGIKLNSISGLGKKDEDIVPIESVKIPEIEKLATNYALGKRKKIEDQMLRYESIIIK